MKRRGFTLIEMLCVLAITGILAALLANTAANSIEWARWGFEEDVIAAQFEQALDMIEDDVRQAKDIDVDHWDAYGNDLSTIRTSLELRLRSVDTADAAREGTIVYTVQLSDGVYNEENPPERPRPSAILMREQDDSIHSGNKQAMAMYLNLNQQDPHGFTVTYYDRSGTRCSLAEDIASVRVSLAGTTKDGTTVMRTRQIPLAAKPGM